MTKLALRALLLLSLTLLAACGATAAKPAPQTSLSPDQHGIYNAALLAFFSDSHITDILQSSPQHRAFISPTFLATTTRVPQELVDLTTEYLKHFGFDIVVAPQTGGIIIDLGIIGRDEKNTTAVLQRVGPTVSFQLTRVVTGLNDMPTGASKVLIAYLLDKPAGQWQALSYGINQS